MRRDSPSLWLALDGLALAISAGFAVWSVAFVDQAFLISASSRTLAFPATTWKPWLSPTSEGWWWSNRMDDALGAILTALGPGLAVVMISRVLRDGRRASMGPGFAAVFVGCLTLAMHLIEARIDAWITPPTPGSSSPGYMFWYSYSHTVAPAIFGVWAWTFASRRWRARPPWPERLGRLYGWAWIALFLWQGMVWSILWG